MTADCWPNRYAAWEWIIICHSGPRLKGTVVISDSSRNNSLSTWKRWKEHDRKYIYTPLIYCRFCIKKISASFNPFFGAVFQAFCALSRGFSLPVSVTSHIENLVMRSGHRRNTYSNVCCCCFFVTHYLFFIFGNELLKPYCSVLEKGWSTGLAEAIFISLQLAIICDKISPQMKPIMSQKLCD